MRDVAPTFERRLVAVGVCDAADDPYGVAWTSTTGTDWRRILETEPGFELWGVSTNGGTEGVLIVGESPEDVPRLWHGSFRALESIELPTSDGRGGVHDVDWDGDRYLIVGYENAPDPGADSLPVAWLDANDGMGWRRIDIPKDVYSFRDVAGGETDDGYAFTVVGLATDFGRMAWTLGDDEQWTAKPLPGRGGGVFGLIDAHTAFGNVSMWTERNGSWRRHPYPQLNAQAGLRLDEGYLVTGKPTPKHAWPEVLIASADGDDWIEVARSPDGADTTIAEFVHFGGVIAVGDAVYKGPGELDAYLP